MLGRSSLKGNAQVFGLREKRQSPHGLGIGGSHASLFFF